MQVTLGEEGSWVSMAVFFLLINIGLERDLPLLLLPTLLLKNRISGGGYFSARPGLDMGFDDSFIFTPKKKLFSFKIAKVSAFFFFFWPLAPFLSFLKNQLFIIDLLLHYSLCTQ